MKKIILSCVLLLTAGAALAQVSNLNRADMALQKAMADPKNPDYTQIDAAWGFVQLAMEHEKTATNPVTWDKAALIQSYYMNKMVNDKNVTGEIDLKKFFATLKLVSDYYLKCDDLEHTPNKKGKMPKEVFRPINAVKIKNLRPNFRNAGGMLSTSDPDLSIMYINYYNETAKHPIYTGMTDLADPENVVGDVNYYLATAYKTKGDTVNAIPALEKAMASPEYGKYACGELIMMLDKQGREDEKMKWIEYGYKNYPELSQYGQMYLSDKLSKEDWNGALTVADEIIARFPDDKFAHYNKGFAYVKQEKFDEALAAYAAVLEFDPNDIEVLSMLGQISIQQAQRLDEKTEKEKRNAMYEQAVEYFKRVEALDPDKTDVYGYSLYLCYNNLNQPAKAKAYKKYYDSMK